MQKQSTDAPTAPTGVTQAETARLMQLALGLAARVGWDRAPSVLAMMLDRAIEAQTAGDRPRSEG